MNDLITRLCIGLTILLCIPAVVSAGDIPNENFPTSLATHSIMDLGLTIESASVDPNDQICLDVTVDNFTNINGAQFSIAFDESQLDFDQVTNFGLPGMSVASFGTNNADNGVLTFTWTDPELDGHTTVDGTVIFEICFTVIGNNTSTVTFSNTPTSIEVIDANDMLVGTQETNSTVTNSADGGGGSMTDLALSIESETVDQGQNVCLDITANGFTDINGLQFTITFDESQLDYTGVDNFGLPGISAASFGTNNADNGVVTFTWTDPELDGSTVSDGTVIFQICFDAIGSGTTNVEFSNTPTGIEAINTSDEEVTVNTSNGAVTINGGSGGGGNGFEISIESASVNNGQEVCLEVTADDFTDLNGLQFTIAFDENQLDFTQVMNFGLPGISAASFGTNNADNGFITFTWTDPDLDGTTVSNGTVIFEICFDAIGSGATNVSFSNTPTSIEAINTSDEEVTVGTNNGTVTINGGSGGGGNGFEISIESASVNNGQEVCLEVTADDFTDLNGLQFTIAFDESQLDFTQVMNFGLPGISAASFGTNNADNGFITFTWTDPDLDGTTVPNGTVIFEVCFNAIGSGTTNVNFSNTPTSIEAINTSDEEVTVGTNNGTVTINGNGGGGNGFQINMGSATVNSGDEVCLPVTVNDFTDINGLQFTIVFDETQLAFTQTTNFGLPGISGASFGTNNAANGVVTFTWTDPDLDGTTVSDGTTIFEICFTANGTGTTTVDFSNTPTSIEVINTSDEEVPATTSSGTVTINGNGGGGDGFQLNMGSATVNSGDEVCLPVTVNDFTDINGLQFTIVFDETQLAFTQTTNFGIPGISAASFGTNNAANGIVTFTWTDPELNGTTVSDGTTIFEICFTANGTGTTTVDFSNSPTAIEVTNTSDELVPATTNSGTVTINGGGGGDGFQLSLEDAMVASGQEVCLDVTVNDFIDINGLQFTIEFDETLLDFTQVTSFGLPNMSAASFGTNNAANGVVTFTWTDPDLNGTTVSDGTVIFEICFTAVGPNGTTTDVDFTNSPTAIEVINADDEEVPATTNSGTVTIGTNMGTPDPVVVTVGGATVNQFDNVCVDVSVEDFTDITQLQFTITFDQNQLTFTGLDNFNLPGLDVNDFNTSNAANGSISFTWNGGATTVADGTSIFQICFDADGDSPSDVNVTNGQATNSGGQFPDVNGVSGTINITSLPPGFSIITGSNDGACADVIGSEICIPVSVNNFTDINGIQFTVAFDPAILQFNSVGAFGLPGLFASNFGTTNAGSGIITFNWVDLELNGHTLDGLSVIFEVCFTLLAEPAGLSQVAITGSPTAIEVIDASDMEVTANILNGNVRCGNDIQPPVIVTDAVENVSCAGLSDGSIMITEVSGSGPFDYVWGDNGATGPNRIGLSAGNYTVTITDQGTGLTVEKTYGVGQPTPLSISNPVVTDVNCGADGSIFLNISGGTPPYMIDWSGNLPDGSNTVSGLDAGTYSVTVTDNNGCENTIPAIVVDPGNPLLLSSVVTTISDAENGAIDLTPSGGTAPYNHVWTFPNGNNAFSEDLNGLTEPGEYCVTTTDSGGCSNSICVTVGLQLEIISFTTTRACFGQATGGIDITVAGGTGPGTYTFTWNGPSCPGTDCDTEDLTNILAGTYNLTVVDGSPSVVTATITVPSYDEIVATPTIVESGNTNDQGSISLDVTGGSPGYTYSWSNTSQTGPNITGLSTGEYCVTITDNVGCQSEECFFVPAAELSILSITPISISCNGETDGQISVMAEGGILPYTVQVNEEAPVTSNMVPVVVGGLSAGTYTVTVTDANGNTLPSQEVTVIEPDPLSSTSDFVFDTEDTGCSGSITLNIQGGTEPYTVTWSGTDQTGPQVIQLCAGTYIPTVVDANGCMLNPSAVVISSISSNFTIEQASCADATDGSIIVAVSGGSDDYSFEWTQTGSTDIVDQDSILNNQLPGNYTVTITDASGAQLVRMYELDAASSFTSDVNITSDYNGFEVSCADGANGAAEAIVINGAGGSFVYEWFRGEEMVSVGQTVDNLPPGDITLLVVDQNTGCESEVNFTLDAPEPLELAADITDVSCPGDRDGDIIVQVSGGTVGFFYNYEWSDGQDGARANNLPPGDFTVTVTDANLCTLEETYTVSEPAPITVNVETTNNTDFTNENCDGSVRLIVEGGNAPYIYEWENVEETTAVATDLCAGEYFINVLDAKGCEFDLGTIVATVGLDGPGCFEESLVISPDGNGQNDQFQILCIEQLTNNRLEIYNRWGQLVFEQNDYDNTWMGTTNDNAELPEGPYYWVLEYTDMSGTNVQQTGSLTLLRD